VTDEPGRRSAAETAADKVRAIVDAAERSATELEEAARTEARRIRADAERETEEQLRRMQAAADRLAARADDLEGALEQLAGRVREAIATLREDLRDLRAAPAAPGPDKAAKPEVVAEPVPEVDAELEPAVVAEPEPELAEPDPAPAPPGGSEGARVIALNMALGGSTREETARYLDENFELDDRDALLDDVYARAGGA